MLIFGQNAPLISPTFLKRSLVFRLLLFSSSSIHCSLKKAFLSLLFILWKSALFGCTFLFLPCFLLLFLLQLFFSWVQFSRSVMSDSLQPHGPQHTRPPCPSPTPGVYSNSCPSSQWCHPAISSSVVPFSSVHKPVHKWTQTFCVHVAAYPK